MSAGEDARLDDGDGHDEKGGNEDAQEDVLDEKQSGRDASEADDA